MKLDIDKFFCEIIGGLVATILLLPIMEWLGLGDVETVWRIVVTDGNAYRATAVIGGAYLFGIVVDGLLMPSDGLLQAKLGIRSPDQAHLDRYWQVAGAHVVAYRDHVWAYYFCYRNLVVMAPVLTIVWGIWLIGHQQALLALALVVASALVARALWASMRDLLALYYDLVAHVGSTPAAPAAGVRP